MATNAIHREHRFDWATATLCHGDNLMVDQTLSVKGVASVINHCHVTKFTWSST